MAGNNVWGRGRGGGGEVDDQAKSGGVVMRKHCLCTNKNKSSANRKCQWLPLYGVIVRPIVCHPKHVIDKRERTAHRAQCIGTLCDYTLME